MKLVVAIIKPFKLDEVREALATLGVQGMTVTEVKGFGRQKGQTEIYRGAEYSTNMVPKIKVEVATTDALAGRVVEAIQQAANTGAIGDGKIFVLEIGQAVRIRTGETDDVALSRFRGKHEAFYKDWSWPGRARRLGHVGDASRGAGGRGRWPHLQSHA